MDKLIIQLTGQIEHSNFDAWKQHLISQIQAVNIELTTDDDFIRATNHVKFFKSAERALKEAKQSAINQAVDIQRLFAAIDHVAQEARQTRLSLERQIKARKQQIKTILINTGIETIQLFINQQPADFQQIDHSPYLNRQRFEEATKRKATIHTLQSAIDALCQTIKQEISHKAAEVVDNGRRLDQLPNHHKLLFQDRTRLIALPQTELELEITKRIALYKEETLRQQVEKTTTALEQLENIELNPEITPLEALPEKYRLMVDMVASKEEAIEIARAIRQMYEHHPAISNIRLIRHRE